MPSINPLPIRMMATKTSFKELLAATAGMQISYSADRGMLPTKINRIVAADKMFALFTEDGVSEHYYSDTHTAILHYGSGYFVWFIGTGKSISFHDLVPLSELEIANRILIKEWPVLIVGRTLIRQCNSAEDIRKYRCIEHEDWMIQSYDLTNEDRERIATKVAIEINKGP